MVQLDLFVFEQISLVLVLVFISKLWWVFYLIFICFLYNYISSFRFYYFKYMTVVSLNV